MARDSHKQAAFRQRSLLLCTLRRPNAFLWHHSRFLLAAISRIGNHLPCLLNGHIQHLCDLVRHFHLHYASMQTLQTPSAQEVQAEDRMPQNLCLSMLCFTQMQVT